MSVQNRQLKEGIYTIVNETKFQTSLGRVYCVFAGHKKAELRTEKGILHFCICCMKQFKYEPE